MLRERLWPPNLRNQIRVLKRDLDLLRLDRDQTSWRLEPMKYPGAEIMLDVRSAPALSRRDSATKEPLTVAWIEALPAGDVLYDIGANVGGYSLIAACRPQGPLRVFAFEASYANYASLCDNIVANDVGDRVTPIPLPLGDRTELATFAYRDLRPGTALHASSGQADFEAVYEQPTLAFRLDELVERFELPAPQHIKLDVDGAELAVLHGAGDLLGSDTLRSLMVELDPDVDEPIDRLIRGQGFTPVQEYRRSEEGVRYLQYERA